MSFRLGDNMGSVVSKNYNTSTRERRGEWGTKTRKGMSFIAIGEIKICILLLIWSFEKLKYI